MPQFTENIPLYKLDDTSLISKWHAPTKKIFSAVDIPCFLKSRSIHHINATISHICSKISLKNVIEGALDANLVDFENQKGQEASDNRTSCPQPPSFASETVEHLDIQPMTKCVLNILDELIKLEIETPPIPGPRRYGNFAFREWQDKLNRSVSGVLDSLLSSYFDTDEKKLNYSGFKDELMFYLTGSFGSRERMDYGTGHELAFVSFLGCLIMTGLIDSEAVDGHEYLLILAKYYDLVKSLILIYTLEPAGSHGVWGLDDHFHLVYVFGSCQLIDYNMMGKDMKNNRSEEYAKVLNYCMGLTPSSVLNNETLEKYRVSNLYYNAISFIKKVKSGPFREHSPMLYEISFNKSWVKVARGMLRMYYGEVLSKFPVVQHFYFGGVFYPWVDVDGIELKSSEGAGEDRIESTHFTSTVFNEPIINPRGSRLLSQVNRKDRRSNIPFDGITRAPWSNRKR